MIKCHQKLTEWFVNGRINERHYIAAIDYVDQFIDKVRKNPIMNVYHHDCMIEVYIDNHWIILNGISLELFAESYLKDNRFYRYNEKKREWILRDV